MSSSREAARRRQLPFRLGLQENDRIAAHVVYALYAASLLTAVPALLGVVLAHLKRADVNDSWLESHAIWQIRTFWIMLISSIISAVLTATFVLIPLAVLLSGLTWLWFAYRTIKGWIRLNDNAPIDDPEAFI